MILDRTTAPQATPISKPNFPSFSSSTSNGTKIVTFDHSSQPIVFLELIFESGKTQESIVEQSYLTSKLLTGGTKKNSAESIAETLDFFGSHLEITSSFDSFNIKLYCLKKFFPQVLVLLEDLLNNCDFPNKELAIQKGIREQQLKQQESKNNLLASRIFRQNLFLDHPYGTYPKIEDLKKIDKEHLIDFYETKLKTQPRIYLTGDIDDNIINEVTAIFKNRVAGKPFIHKIYDNDVFNDYAEKEDAVQTSLRIGAQCVNRNHEDYHYLKITNDLLGGYFGSRLMKNIREDKGLTYGISSSISHLKNASYWIIGSDVLKEKRQLAVDEIEKEIRLIQNEPVSSDELDSLKNYLRGKFLSAFDSPFSSAQMIKTVSEWDLGVDAWQAYFEAIDKIDPTKIQEMAIKYFDLRKLNKIMVG